MPASPSERDPSGRVACFVTPGAKSAYGRRSRSATVRDTASISRSSSGSSDERHAGRARDELDGAVVVGRAEAAGDEAHVGAHPLPQRLLELRGRVADDRDPRRLEPEPQRLAGVERAVAVGAVAAYELAARDDDRRPRPAHPEMRVVCVGVTTTRRFGRAGSETALPPSWTCSPPGRRT